MITTKTEILVLVFLIYGYVISYIVANITGQVKNKRGIRLHHYELGYWLFSINLILFGLSLIFIPIISSLFLYMSALSLGIFLSDIKDFLRVWLND